jgi:hypothetical protein
MAYANPRANLPHFCLWNNGQTARQPIQDHEHKMNGNNKFEIRVLLQLFLFNYGGEGLSLCVISCRIVYKIQWSLTYNTIVCGLYKGSRGNSKPPHHIQQDTDKCYKKYIRKESIRKWQSICEETTKAAITK